MSISMKIVIIWWAHEWSHASLHCVLERNERFNCHNLLIIEHGTMSRDATPNFIVLHRNEIKNVRKFVTEKVNLRYSCYSCLWWQLARAPISWLLNLIRMQSHDKGLMRYVGSWLTKLQASPSVRNGRLTKTSLCNMSEIIQDWQYRCRRTRRMLIINEISWFYVTSFRQVVEPLFVWLNITWWELNTIFLRKKVGHTCVNGSEL